MKKSKYTQIFSYLKEFSKLRSNPVRDIDTQESQYPEKFWLNDISENELFENIIRPSFNENNEYWLKIRKPKEPLKPEFAKLSDTLEKWIDPPTLLTDDDEPRLKDCKQKRTIQYFQKRRMQRFRKQPCNIFRSNRTTISEAMLQRLQR